jgi:hypothetical protein
VIPVELSEAQRAEALRALAESGVFRTEATTDGKDGTPVYVDGITIALRAKRGPITGYMNIGRDITACKRALFEAIDSSSILRSPSALARRAEPDLNRSI